MNTPKSAKTLVIGASENPSRYSHMAVSRLRLHDFPVEAIGLRPGKIDEVEIQTGMPALSDIDTVTLYINPDRQEPFRGYIINLKPRRVIFNPGTESPDFEAELRSNGIEPVEACTLVMLSTGLY